MQWLKFSLVCLVLISFESRGAKFSSSECLKSTYETKVAQNSKFFGLIKNSLNIKKSNCSIEIKFKGILETVWDLDICREPIHMKVLSKGTQSVYKRDKKCLENDESDFCYFKKELILNLQDEGLIFAKGERENIKDSHGQVYCSYLLVEKYLDQGILFSLYDEPIDIYKEGESCAIPVNNDVQNNNDVPSKENLQSDLEEKEQKLENAKQQIDADPAVEKETLKKDRF